MELHILGPAFGLPSIDAECTAAVALLQLYAPGQHSLIPTHQNPTHLPRLIDGNAHFTGYDNIVRHLESTSSSNSSDATAFSAFLHSNAPLLLDVAQYVSFENYRHVTRPAFSRILPWHTNYILPPQRRAAGRARTAHLGVSSIDIDDVHEDLSGRNEANGGMGGNDTAFADPTQQRASRLLPQKETLMSLLRRPEHAAAFKLHALADNFFGPLLDVVPKEKSDGKYLFGAAQPEAVDCLLVGYLALMLRPKLPQDWLAATMRRKYTALVAYTERLIGEFELETDVDAVLALNSPATTMDTETKLSLPWRPAVRATTRETLNDIAAGIFDQVPVLGGASSRLQLLDAPLRPRWESLAPPVVLSSIALGAAIVTISLRQGWLVWPRGQEVHLFGRRRFADLGDLGSALAGLNLLAMPAAQAES